MPSTYDWIEAMPKKAPPPCPSQVLRKYLGEISVSEAAVSLRVHRTTLSRILTGRASISPDMAYRLASAFGTEPEFWARVQMRHDLHQARKLKRPNIERLPESQTLQAERAAAIKALRKKDLASLARLSRKKSIFPPIPQDEAVALTLKLGIFTPDGQVGEGYR